MPDLPPVKTLPPVATSTRPANGHSAASVSAAVTAASSSVRSIPHFFTRPRLTILPSILLLLALLVATLSISPTLRASTLRQPFVQGASSPDPALAAPPASARASLAAWTAHLRATSETDDVRTTRVACREMEAGAQSCVFEGVACVNVSAEVVPTARPLIYLVHDGMEDNSTVASDNWCKLRHYSSDPRYFSSRHWPIMPGTVAPQQSCLNARWRTADKTLGAGASGARVRWVPEGLSLVDLDYTDNPHNNHMLKDILWLLDTALFQDSLSVQPRPGYAPAPEGDSHAHIFKPDSKIYLPQGRKDFEKQTSRDVNRLTYSTILRRNLSKLYPTLSEKQLSEPSQERRLAVPILEAYPDLASKMVFHRDVLAQSGTDLVCTPRLTVGAKIGNGAHERVCRYLRNESYKLYGIKVPARTRHGQIYYSQPPRRVMILQRHVTRKIINIDELYKALRASLDPHKIAVEVVLTSALKSAEDHVRIFSRAGVLLTSHGSQNMGQIWMPRHSSLIEIMPVGYTDYAFNLLSDSCRLWYYELQSLPHPNKTDEFYMEKCGKLKPHMMNPCTQVKSMDVVANVSQTLRTVRFALERMGFALDPWMDYVRHG